MKPWLWYLGLVAAVCGVAWATRHQYRKPDLLTRCRNAGAV